MLKLLITEHILITNFIRLKRKRIKLSLEHSSGNKDVGAGSEGSFSSNARFFPQSD